MDIAADLRPESFRAGPANLGAEPFQERQGQWGLLGEVNGMEVEQVGFDREGVCAEGGAIADVGQRIEGFAGGACADFQCGDVDAVGRQQFRVGREVDGGDGVAGAVASARGGCGLDSERATEERTCVAYVALGDKVANAAR